MASQDQFECTQIIQTSPSEDATSQEQVASLILNGLEHPIFNGTKIGRDPKQCSVAIDRKSVSFHHALIEVELGQHFLSDLGSTNSTHLNGLRLKPNIKYEVPDGAVVQVADLCGTYHILPLKKPELETSAQDIFEPILCSTLAWNLDMSDDIITCEAETPIGSDLEGIVLSKTHDEFEESSFHLHWSPDTSEVDVSGESLVDSPKTPDCQRKKSEPTPFWSAKSRLSGGDVEGCQGSLENNIATEVPDVSQGAKSKLAKKKHVTAPEGLRRSSRLKERSAALKKQ